MGHPPLVLHFRQVSEQGGGNTWKGQSPSQQGTFTLGGNEVSDGNPLPWCRQDLPEKRFGWTFTVGGVQEDLQGLGCLNCCCRLGSQWKPAQLLLCQLSAHLQCSVVKQGFARAPPCVEVWRSSPQRSLCSWKLRALQGAAAPRRGDGRCALFHRSCGTAGVCRERCCSALCGSTAPSVALAVCLES